MRPLGIDRGAASSAGRYEASPAPLAGASPTFEWRIFPLDQSTKKSDAAGSIIFKVNHRTAEAPAPLEPFPGSHSVPAVSGGLSKALTTELIIPK